jgi:4-amino-4-deoxy-L-arabinose transferase-like glycosyltransferase
MSSGSTRPTVRPAVSIEAAAAASVVPVPLSRLAFRPSVVVFAIAALIAGLALSFELGSWDVENDEAIYTYAVERMIDTGDWMTAREIPNDFAFLEKPPLKFWMVGLPIRLGLLPRTEAGFRAIDALLGAVAFGYVALLGYRLAGTATAIASCLILFGLRDLVLLHGIRSNNMEASLVAAYCGGLYHFLRWRHQGARRDALVTGAWFTLAFLTKFVAAAFLPLVALISLALPRPGLLPKPARACLADWLWAAALWIGTSAPWFVYEYSQFGGTLIETMFLQHVFVRFTAALDPIHLQPWNYYYLGIVRMLTEARCGWLVAAGAALLAYRVVRYRDGLAWTLVVWAAVPLALISGLSSKVQHYTYPFLPPLALAGGLALAAPVSMFKPHLARLADRLEGIRLRGLPSSLSRPGVRRVFVAIGVLALVIAAIALVAGSTKVVIGGVVLRNSSVLRPLAVAALAFALAQAWRHALTWAPVALLLLLPLNAARETLLAASRPAHPLRALRDCARPLVDAGRVRGGAHAVARDPLPHTYAFYALPLGSWDTATTFDPTVHGPALDDPAQPRALVLSGRAFSDLALQRLRDGKPLPPGIRAHASVIVLLPGPLGACIDDAVRAGARRVDRLEGRP